MSWDELSEAEQAEQFRIHEGRGTFIRTDDHQLGDWPIIHQRTGVTIYDAVFRPETAGRGEVNP
jgi:hypothetical protein